MSKEKKDDSNEAPPAKIGETQEEQLIKDCFSICPECSYSI